MGILRGKGRWSHHDGRLARGLVHGAHEGLNGLATKVLLTIALAESVRLPVSPNRQKQSAFLPDGSNTENVALPRGLWAWVG
jgi:hypothetical protein